MSQAVRNLEPKQLWNKFADLNAVPRPSKKEERVIAFMVEFGKNLGLEVVVDPVENVIIKKPATAGMENRKTIVMQSHLDMVHQKNNDTIFDFDKEGNMWVTNSETGNQLAKRDVNGEWESFAVGGGTIDSDKVGFVMVDSRGYKWVQVFIKHMVVFSEDATINSRQLNSREGNGNLASDVVWSAVEDLNGDVWLGTDGGVSVFYNPQNILEPGNNYDASSVLVEFDGFVEKLLDGEKVYDIAVDGANRKWFATSSGVYLTSPDGTEEIQHFTAENSPLLDNKVKIGFPIVPVF